MRRPPSKRALTHYILLLSLKSDLENSTCFFLQHCINNNGPIKAKQNEEDDEEKCGCCCCSHYNCGEFKAAAASSVLSNMRDVLVVVAPAQDTSSTLLRRTNLRPRAASKRNTRVCLVANRRRSALTSLFPCDYSSSEFDRPKVFSILLDLLGTSSLSLERAPCAEVCAEVRTEASVNVSTSTTTTTTNVVLSSILRHRC